MDKFLNFFKEFMPLLEHYPAWAKYLFGITLLLVLSSLFLFIILFPSASAKKKTEQATAVINFAVALLDDTQAKASGVSLGNECRRVLDSEGLREVAIRHILGPDGQRIEPFSPYLSRLLRGEPVGPLTYPYQSGISWCPPNLDFKVANNGDKTILLHTIVFEINESINDPSPLIVFEDDCLRYNAFQVLLANEGWCKIENCSMDFNLKPITIKEKDDSNVVWNLLAKMSIEGPYRHSIPINDFETSTDANLLPAFIEEGIQVEPIHREEGIAPWGVEEFTAKKLELGKFRSGSALVYGELHFTPVPRSPDFKERQTIKFATVVHLVNQRFSGAALPSSYLYKTEFLTDKNNYTVTVPIAHSLRPGEADRFNMQVFAKQSSLHKFRVKLLYNQNDSVVSEPMEMRILVPRSVSKRLKKYVSGD